MPPPSQRQLATTEAVLSPRLAKRHPAVLTSRTYLPSPRNAAFRWRGDVASMWHGACTGAGAVAVFACEPRRSFSNSTSVDRASSVRRDGSARALRSALLSRSVARRDFCTLLHE